MQTPDINPIIRSEYPAWQLLAEFSFKEFINDHERSDGLTTRCLFQSVEALRIPGKCLENIDGTLTWFAEEALLRSMQGKYELTGRIRLFCQDKPAGDLYSTKISRLSHPLQALEPVQAIHQSTAKMIGGWGYFLIERGGATSTDMILQNSVDLYLYKEGE